MPKNRVIYASEDLYTGPTPATGQHFSSGNSGINLVNQLYRIQSANYSFSLARQPIRQYGEYASIDLVQLQTPTVSLGFDYILANFSNEKALGLVVDGYGNALSGIMNKTRDDRNYFIKTSAEGVEAYGDTTSDSTVSVIGIGNGFLSSYAAKAAVGAFPSVAVSVDGLNMTMQSTTSGVIPAINSVDGSRISSYNYTVPSGVSNPGTGLLDISALRPGDITLTITQRQAEDEGIVVDATGTYNTVGVSISDAKIQSFNLAFSLNRDAIQKLGSRYSFSREVVYPIPVTCAIDALVGDLTTGSLSDLVNCDNAYDIQINMYQPNQCNGAAARPVIAQYIVKNAKMNGQSFSSSIGSNKSVSLQFTSEIGGPKQSNVGLFMSGVAPTFAGGYV